MRRHVVAGLVAVLLAVSGRRLAATVLVGGVYEHARAFYELRTITGLAKKWRAPKVRVQTIVASPRGTSPETALVISAYAAADRRHRKTRAVYDLVRPSEHDRGLLRSRVYLAANKIKPLVALIDPLSTPIEQSQRMNGIPLNRLSHTLATALNHPGRKDARKFTRDPYRTAYRKDVYTWRLKHARIEANFSPTSPSTAWPTRFGGALAIVPGYLAITRVMLDDWSLSFPKGNPVRKKFPHHYSSGRWDYASSSIVAIPARGRLRLVEADSDFIHLSMVRDYAW